MVKYGLCSERDAGKPPCKLRTKLLDRVTARYKTDTFMDIPSILAVVSNVVLTIRSIIVIGIKIRVDFPGVVSDKVVRPVLNVLRDSTTLPVEELLDIGL